MNSNHVGNVIGNPIILWEQDWISRTSTWLATQQDEGFFRLQITDAAISQKNLDALLKQVDSQLDRFEDVAAIVMVAANHFFSRQLITAMGNYHLNLDPIKILFDTIYYYVSAHCHVGLLEGKQNMLRILLPFCTDPEGRKVRTTNSTQWHLKRLPRQPGKKWNKYAHCA